MFLWILAHSIRSILLLLLLLFIYLFILTANGVSPGGIGTTIGRNTQHTSTIKVTIHTMNTIKHTTINK
jgi:hypothetical protein